MENTNVANIAIGNEGDCLPNEVSHLHKKNSNSEKKIIGEGLRNTGGDG